MLLRFSDAVVSLLCHKALLSLKVGEELRPSASISLRFTMEIFPAVSGFQYESLERRRVSVLFAGASESHCSWPAALASGIANLLLLSSARFPTSFPSLPSSLSTSQTSFFHSFIVPNCLPRQETPITSIPCSKGSQSSRHAAILVNRSLL